MCPARDLKFKQCGSPGICHHKGDNLPAAVDTRTAGTEKQLAPYTFAAFGFLHTASGRQNRWWQDCVTRDQET